MIYLYIVQHLAPIHYVAAYIKCLYLSTEITQTQKVLSN